MRTKDRNDGHSVFDILWEAYPRKESKLKAEEYFNRALANGNRKRPDKKRASFNVEEDLIVALKWIEEAEASEQWQTRTKIPHFSTWLNQERWKSDPPPRAEPVGNANGEPRHESKPVAMTPEMVEYQRRERERYERQSQGK